MTGTIKIKTHIRQEFTSDDPTAIKSTSEAYYYWNGKEIAHFSSKDNVLYLRTDYLAQPFSLPYPERMAKAPQPEMWEDLKEWLNINPDTKLSEYTNA